MRPAISQVCSLPASFEQDLEGYSAAACGAVEIWLGKLEAYLDQHQLDDAERLLADSGLAAPVASFQGGLWTSQGDARREHWAHFARRLALCRRLRVGTLVVAGDLLGLLAAEDLDRARVSLADAARLAGEADVRLAFEFQAQASLANNLETAAALVAESDSPHLGLCLDAFHFFTGPSKEADLGYLTTENLFHVQLSDLADTPRELARDADRILPGDGDLRLEGLVSALRAIDYQGCVALEVMNPRIWRAGPRQVGEIGITALRKTLGQASMHDTRFPIPPSIE
jgi:2-keto-myo-inositol isomerase